MTPFKEIISANPKAGEMAMELVYKALTEKRCHRWVIRETIGNSDILVCSCGNTWDTGSTSLTLQPLPQGGCSPLPALLTSLDAWRPLWERMEKEFDGERKFKYGEYLCKSVSDEKGSLTGVFENLTAKPHHHLEAALRTLEVECPECEGETMPVLGKEDRKILEQVPMTMLNEEQAQVNHSQSLARLKERHGLELTEAYAISKRVRWHEVKDTNIHDIVKYFFCTCNAGKRTLYDIWKIKNKEEVNEYD